MIARPGFVIGCHPDCPLAGNRAFVFTNTATDAAPGIHIGLLKPDQDIHAASRSR